MTSQLWGRAFVRGELREDALIVIDDGQIVDVRDPVRRPTNAEPVAGVILPGFIDVHVHGGAGADFMDGTDEAVAAVTEFHARNGTTMLAATTLSSSREDLRAAVRAIARNRQRPRAAEICAIHLEGPYISLHRAGAVEADVRPLEMDRADLRRARALPVARDRADGRAQVLARARQRRRRQHRRAVARVELRHRRDGLVRAVHEVGAGAAVHVHVDEAGQDHAGDRLGVRRPAHGIAHVDDLPVVDDDERVLAKLAAHERAAPQLRRHTLILPSQATGNSPQMTGGVVVRQPPVACRL